MYLDYFGTSSASAEPTIIVYTNAVINSAFSFVFIVHLILLLLLESDICPLPAYAVIVGNGVGP